MARFKQLLATDQLIPTFALGRMMHPMIVDMFGLAGGYHGFWIDQEHATSTSEELIAVTAAARANGFDSFVRLPPTGYWQVTQCLEAGAGGVMGAQIHTAAQAREFASWAKFAPEGTRGLNLSGRDADYTHKPAARFVEEANRDTFVAIQVETLGALEQVAEIAALPSVDLLFVGPADLSLALGVVGQFDHEKLWEAIERVATACRQHGKAWGAVVPTPAFASRALEHGCRMPSVGNDPLVLRRGIEALQGSFSDVFTS